MSVPEKRRFAAAYLRCMDAGRAAKAVGGEDGIRLLAMPGVQKELELQRSLSEVKRNEKGTVEIKLVDRIRALERLLEAGGGDVDWAEAFFAAAAGDGEEL